ncbi:MAG: hypothetical protein ACE5J6_01810 [Candidatus Bathyarchaeia archaeon]
MVSKKLFAVLIIPMLLIPLAGYGYAHWTDTVFKRYKFHFKWSDCLIKSYKSETDIPNYGDSVLDVYPPTDLLPTDTLVVTANVSDNWGKPGNWSLWIGLLIHNQGVDDVLLDVPDLTIDPAPKSAFFEQPVTYFYGPYTQGDFATADPIVWDSIKYPDLPPPGEIPPGDIPVLVEPCHKIVMWIFLELKQDYSGPTFIIEITVTLVQTLASP